MSTSAIATATASAAASAQAAARRRGGKGRAARRSAAKNASHVLDYLENLEDCDSLTELRTYMETEGIQLARVTRVSGAGRLKVTLQDGTAEVDVNIAGSLKFKGKAGTKTDRANCMCVNDLVVLHGPQAAGKLPRELFGQLQGHFDRLSVSYPDGFFAKSSSETTVAAAKEMGYEWEVDEDAVTAALAKKVAAPKGAKGSKREGAGGGAAADATEGEEEDAVDISKI
jgi:hypothetical protein